MSERRCHAEGCTGEATRDTPLCTDHWRAAPERLRRAYMDLCRAIVRTVENDERREA